MENQMLRTASGMKDIASKFSTHIKRDTDKLDKMSSKTDKNLKNTSKEDKRLKELNQKTKQGFCARIMTLLFAFVLFFFTFFMIRFFPLKLARAN